MDLEAIVERDGFEAPQARHYSEAGSAYERERLVP
jgi:hypothetical protein